METGPTIFDDAFKTYSSITKTCKINFDTFIINGCFINSILAYLLLFDRFSKRRLKTLLVTSSRDCTPEYLISSEPSTIFGGKRSLQATKWSHNGSVFLVKVRNPKNNWRIFHYS